MISPDSMYYRGFGKTPEEVKKEAKMENFDKKKN